MPGFFALNETNILLDENLPQSGLLHALVLDGQGGARQVAYADIATLHLAEAESLWLHWDRGRPNAQDWLRRRSGLSAFACDVLLEENTRPRLLTLPNDELLLFLRGVNLNPDSEPEDMVSLRVFADARRVISLRLRPLRSTEAVIRQLEAGVGPKTPSEILLSLADALTNRVDDLVSVLTEKLDGEEDRVETDERYSPPQDHMLSMRRQAASLRRFLLPQREIYGQLTRNRLPWFVDDDTDYWNELSNRLIRYLEELDLVRERVNLILEAEERRMRERMNRTMYILGIITGFFLPMSFLTGLLGINVGGIPGAEHPYGFYLACGVITAVAGFQWFVFRRLKWV